MNVTPEQLDEWNKICEGATPGEWDWRNPNKKDSSDIIYYEPFTDGSKGKGFSNTLICRDGGVCPPDTKTCEFIILSRTALPLLIREVERLNKYIENLESVTKETVRQYAKELASEYMTGIELVPVDESTGD